MSIETLYRVQCGGGCEQYLPVEGLRHAPVTSLTRDAAYFLTFASAYNEAVRRGWSAYPLLCPDCARDLAERVKNGQARRDGDPPEDRRRVPEGDQGPERAERRRAD